MVTSADTPRRASTPGAGSRPAVRLVVVLGLLYAFLVGIALLERGISGMGEDVQAELFRSVVSPLGGLFVGVLGTVLAQSSSVSTATIVGQPQDRGGSA